MKKIYFALILALITTQLIISQTEKSDSSITEIPDTVGVVGVDWFAYPYIINMFTSESAISYNIESY